MKYLICASVLIFAQFVQAEMMDASIIDADAEKVVIDPSIAENITWEEPHFGSRLDLRSIASLKEETQEVNDLSWQGGQLTVLTEIPYTYPQLSRRYLELQTMKKLKNKTQ